MLIVDYTTESKKEINTKKKEERKEGDCCAVERMMMKQQKTLDGWSMGAKGIYILERLYSSS